MLLLELLPNLYFLLQLATTVFLFIHIQIFLHEAAHACVGYSTGFKPKSISVGRGPQLFSCNILSFQFEWHLYPDGGLTTGHRIPPSGLQWRGALYALAGPAMDLYLLILVTRLEAPEGTIYYFMIPICFLVLLCSLVDNLWPGNTCRKHHISNDGTQFLNYVTGTTSAILEEATDALVQEVSRYDPDYSRKDTWIFSIGTQQLDDYVNAAVDIEDGRFDRGVAGLTKILDTVDLHPAERALIYDQIACIPLISGDRDWLSRALAYTEKAHQLVPESPTICGTYGSLLVELGEHEKARELLKPLTTEDSAQMDRSIACSMLAKLYYAEGDSESGEYWLGKAQQSGGEFVINQRVVKELAERYGQPKVA